MGKCFVALNEKGEVFAATWKPDGDLRHYEAKWFPSKVVEVDDPKALDWAKLGDPDDAFDSKKTAAIRALLDERDTLTARVAELEGEVAALRPRPMATAPKDGTRILLAFPSNTDDLDAQPGDALHFPPHVILCRWLALGNNEGWYDGHSFRNCNWLGWSLLPPAMKTVPLSPPARATLARVKGEKP